MPRRSPSGSPDPRSKQGFGGPEPSRADLLLLHKFLLEEQDLFAATAPDPPGRNTSVDAPGLEALGHDTSGADSNAFADFDIRQDHGVCPDNRMRADDHSAALEAAILFGDGGAG